jgi:hypothetical protein
MKPAKFNVRASFVKQFLNLAIVYALDPELTYTNSTTGKRVWIYLATMFQLAMLLWLVLSAFRLVNSERKRYVDVVVFICLCLAKG